jgi:hypothetical protein
MFRRELGQKNALEPAAGVEVKVEAPLNRSEDADCLDFCQTYRERFPERIFAVVLVEMPERIDVAEFV